MENKKLLKFLYKDIAEIEELFIEKGSAGFDKYEIEFIQSRFKGAKQIMQIFSENENKQSHISDEKVLSVSAQPSLNDEEEESLKSLSEFEEEIKESEQSLSQLEEEVVEDKPEEEKEKVQSQLQPEVVVEEINEDSKEESGSQIEDQGSGEAIPASSKQKPESNVKLEDETEVDEAKNRLGDSFSKEKSVNELLANASDKLEDKISKSPVASINTAIGINDRYQYIRELFDGNADNFSKAVSELDKLDSIKEAVAYLQQNYKWKKNNTSLKFVNLVKRRFPNE